MLGRHPLVDLLQHTVRLAAEATILTVLVGFLIYLTAANVDAAWNDGFMAGRATCIQTLNDR